MAAPVPIHVVIDGLLASALVRIADLVITDVLNEEPNTATLTVNQIPHAPATAAFYPPAFDAAAFVTTPVPTIYPSIRRGQPIEIYAGTLTPDARIFAGEIVVVQQVYEGDRPALVAYHLSCTDYTRALNRRKVTKSYLTQSATAIVLDLMASRLADGFSTAFVAPNLPAIAIDFTFEEMNRALTRLANRVGGYWYVDYTKALHFFLEEPADVPAPLVPGGACFADLRVETDLSQVRTRVIVEGAGTTVIARVNPGETMIPVLDPVMFPATGGQAVVGQQRLTYTGVVTGGPGSLVGPGAQPTVGPIVAAQAGAGIEAGAHDYAVTYQSAVGESLPSPPVTVALGQVPPAATAPVPGTPTAGTGPEPGSHAYAVTFVTATGETNAIVGASVTTVAVPGVTPLGAPGAVQDTSSGGIPTGTTVRYVVTVLTDVGESLPGPPSDPVTLIVPPPHISGAWTIRLTLPSTSDPRQTGRVAYRSDNGAPFRKVRTFVNPATTVILDAALSVASNPLAPTVDTTAGAPLCVVPLTGIETGPPAVTARKLYRTAANVTPDASAYRLLATIANNTATTYTDTTPDASLGVALPASNSTQIQQVALSQIPTGGAGVTARRIYRSPANSPALRLLATIANNTTTTYVDAASDATLGAFPPSVDTSGLQQPVGQVTAGATVIPVSGPAAFLPAGGFAIVGNGEQVIRYTGVTPTSLTGVPASGPGSLTATISYNASITVAPALTGVAGIARTLIDGEEIFLLIVRDALAAQTALAAIEGGDGVIEHFIQDRRLSAAGATATADAELALFAAPEVRVTYTTRDPKTRSGKLVAITLPAPTNVTGEFLIQRVQLSHFHIPTLAPLRTVQASSTRFSFEDVLRRLQFEVSA